MMIKFDIRDESGQGMDRNARYTPREKSKLMGFLLFTRFGKGCETLLMTLLMVNFSIFPSLP